MTITHEAARRVLRSWLAIEVLTPQVTKDGWSGLAAERQGQQRNKGKVTPDETTVLGCAVLAESDGAAGVTASCP